MRQRLSDLSKPTPFIQANTQGNYQLGTDKVARLAFRRENCVSRQLYLTLIPMTYLPNHFKPVRHLNTVIKTPGDFLAPLVIDSEEKDNWTQDCR